MSQEPVAKVDVRAALAPILAGSPTSPARPVGFQPLGAAADCPGCDPSEIPQNKDQLGELISYVYDLTVRRAGELNIPVVGSVSGAYDRRVVIYEWTRYKEIPGAHGVRCQYGYVIRFCLTVSKWSVEGKTSLPFLTAKAELGDIQAGWMMQVRGLVGPKIDAVVIPPQELKVETFYIAAKSLTEVIAAINDPTTKFIPGILLARIDPEAAEAAYWRSAVKAFAADSVRRGYSRSDTFARLGSTSSADSDLVSETYAFFGISDPNADPEAGAREQAEKMLRGIRVDK